MKKALKILAIVTSVILVLAIVIAAAFFVVKQLAVPTEKINIIAEGVYKGDNGEKDNEEVVSEVKSLPDLIDHRDNKTYRTVNIGKQVWMAENLNYNVGGSKCYGNAIENCVKYGRLYNWDAAMKACPAGWHLPDNLEWDVLIYFAGGKDVAGTALKSNYGWNYDYNGEDEFSFTALPGGSGSSDGNFYHVGSEGQWWSATEESETVASDRLLHEGSKYFYQGGAGKDFLFSVRCLQGDAKPKAAVKDIDDKLLEDMIFKVVKAFQNEDEAALNQLLHKDIGIALIVSDDVFQGDFRDKISFSDPVFNRYRLPLGKILNPDYKVHFEDLPLWYCEDGKWTKPTGIYCVKNKYIWEEKTFSGILRTRNESEAKIAEKLDGQTQHYNIRVMDEKVSLDEWDVADPQLNRIDFTLTVIDGKLYLTVINMYYYCRPWM